MRRFSKALERINFEYKVFFLCLRNDVDEIYFEIYYDYKNKTVETCRQNGLKILPEVTQELVQEWMTHLSE